MADSEGERTIRDQREDHLDLVVDSRSLEYESHEEGHYMDESSRSSSTLLTRHERHNHERETKQVHTIKDAQAKDQE